MPIWVILTHFHLKFNLFGACHGVVVIAVGVVCHLMSLGLSQDVEPISDPVRQPMSFSCLTRTP